MCCRKRAGKIKCCHFPALFSSRRATAGPVPACGGSLIPCPCPSGAASSAGPSMGLGPPGAQRGGVRSRNWKVELVFLCVFQLRRRVFLFSLEKVLYLAGSYLSALPATGKAVNQAVCCSCSCSAEAKPRRKRHRQPGGKGNYSCFVGNSHTQMG